MNHNKGETMKKDGMTKKEVRDSGMKVWKWLWEHPASSCKTHTPYWDEIKDYQNACAACEFKGIALNCKEGCPLGWDKCSSDDSPYLHWEQADNPTDRAYFAKKIYEAHEAIEVEEEVEIQAGDVIHSSCISWGRCTVRNINHDEKVMSVFFNIGGDDCDRMIYFGSSDDFINTDFVNCSPLQDITIIERPEKPVEHVFTDARIVHTRERTGNQADIYFPSFKKINGRWPGDMLKHLYQKNVDVIIRERKETK
jgi:hypothetical protein